MANKSCFSVNWKYLPVKLHYLFLYAGFAGVMTMMGFRKKDFLHSATSVLFIFLLIPICILVSKFMIGFIADKFGNIKNILMILLVVITISFSTIFHIPPIEDGQAENTNVNVACNEQRENLVIYLSNYEYDPYCDKSTAVREYSCKVFILPYKCGKKLTLSGSFNVMNSLPSSNSTMKAFFFKLHEKYISDQDCVCLAEQSYSFSCEPDINICNALNKKIPEYKMLAFWMFAFLYIINWAGMETMMSLTDAFCFENLRGDFNQYGKQRVWGTIGWRVTYIALGLFKSFTFSELEKYYSRVLFVMLAFFVKDMFLLYVIQFEKSHASIDICKNIRQIFSSLKTVVFVVGVFICGVLSGLEDSCEPELLWELHKNYEFFPLLEKIMYLVAEVVFFVFSGWFVKQIGHFYCLIAVLIAFSLKMGLYYILYNPWWGLPILLLHGITFSLFFTAMTLYAVDCIPPGTEATMLGIFGGIFMGTCFAGAILAHVYIDFGCQRMFLVGSMISLVSALVLMLLYIFISISQQKRKLKKESMMLMKEIATCTSQDSSA